jgi:hypothetical protein
MSRTIVSALLAAIACAAPALAQKDSWVHLSVRDARRHRTEVRINLPAPAVIRAAPLLPESDGDGYRLVVGDESITPRDLAVTLAALRGAAEGATVRRDTGDAILEATRSGDRVQLLVRRAYGDGEVTATLPLQVADALAGGGRKLDLARAVRLLAGAGGGELALIAADEVRIRVWVDGTPDQGWE